MPGSALDREYQVAFDAVTGPDGRVQTARDAQGRIIVTKGAETARSCSTSMKPMSSSLTCRL